MKITWFGDATFRLHIGGAIVVTGADDAPLGIDRNELLSGADHAVTPSGNLPVADAMRWKRRAPVRLLDADDQNRPLEFWSIGENSLLVDADGEAPLVLLGGVVPELGRWAEKAVLVVFGGHGSLAETALAVLDSVAPRLIALAGSEAEVDAAFAALRERLDGTGLVALERGMAVEI